MPKSKKFIDRKNAVTFHLVHRSQQDPLIADEKAPQHVLLPATVDKKSKTSDSEKRKEEQKKFGIFFDDDYDYLQHLRDANQTAVDWEPVEQSSNQTTKLKLPSSVFASEVEEDVGLLNKAAPRSGPQLDWDPDIVAALDEDFDFDDPDNELEDNFIELANAEDGENDMDSDADSYADGDTDDDMNVSEDDDVGSLNGPQYTFAEEETKSQFTNYSISSSVMRRNDQLTLLDDRFEQMFTSCYGESEIGALDCDEIEGHIEPDSELMLQYAEKMEEERKINRPILEPSKESREHEKDNSCTDGEEEEELVPLEVPQDTKEQWDCESILSTYSNIYNRPKLIAEPMVPKKIRVSGRTGIPLGVLDGSDGGVSKLTARALAKHNNTDHSDHDADGTESVISTLSMLSVRPKNETPEERSERKKALRQYRKERRMERKANTLAFKEEKKRQEKVILNNKKNVQGIHML
ncbi:protein LTV1 homolog [Periplaneta americana]|uniref:protein LTV1 homolog n=1 Tax=Periplaneta americana TaxID=6978 RepID=UPI0037E8E3FB